MVQPPASRRGHGSLRAQNASKWLGLSSQGREGQGPRTESSDMFIPEAQCWTAQSSPRGLSLPSSSPCPCPPPPAPTPDSGSHFPSLLFQRVLPSYRAIARYDLCSSLSLLLHRDFFFPESIHLSLAWELPSRSPRGRATPTDIVKRLFARALGPLAWINLLGP